MTDEATGKRSREEQLAWEGRVGRLAGVGALGALLLPLVAQLYFRYAIGPPPRDLVGQLALAAANPTDHVVVAALSGLGVASLGAAMGFLVLASRFRRPTTPSAAIPVIAIASVAVAGAAVAQMVGTLTSASELLAAGPRTPARAREIQAANGATVQQVAFGAYLAFGLAMILTGVSAMRAGLLSRFLGALAIVIGILFAIPILGAPIFLLLFWSGAVALILLDRWPGGRGPAWSTGEATPWPSAMDRRAELERHRVEAEDQAAESNGGEPPARPKRKRGRGRR